MQLNIVNNIYGSNQLVQSSILNEVVIGWSLEAAILAFVKHCPLIVCFENEYLIRHYLKPNLRLTRIGISNTSMTLKTNHGNIKIGKFKRDILAHVQYQLSLLGLFYKGTVAIDSNTVSIRSEMDFIKTFKPATINIVNPEGVTLKNVERIDRQYEICDHNKTLIHNLKYDLLFSGYRKYCQEIWLYNADESHCTNHKDIGIVSILTENEIDDPDYSEHLIKLMCKDVFDQEKIKGKCFKYRLRETFQNNSYIVKNYDNIDFKIDIEIEDILKLTMHDKTKDFLSQYKIRNDS